MNLKTHNCQCTKVCLWGGCPRYLKLEGCNDTARTNPSAVLTTGWAFWLLCDTTHLHLTCFQRAGQCWSLGRCLLEFLETSTFFCIETDGLGVWAHSPATRWIYSKDWDPSSFPLADLSVTLLCLHAGPHLQGPPSRITLIDLIPVSIYSLINLLNVVNSQVNSGQYFFIDKSAECCLLPDDSIQREE